MKQEIKYNGYSANPSDYECADGDLAASIGVVNEDGALKPVLPPSLYMQLNDGETVKYIHKTSLFTHFIIYNSSDHKIYSIDKETTFRTTIGTLSYTLSHFDGIGNTLLAFTDDGIYYYLWKDGAYKLLGNHIPNVDISFGLVGHPRLFSMSDDSKRTFTITFDSIGVRELNFELSENNKTRITDQVMAKVNKFVAQETVNKGRFCFPFFVRYALRLYDGSLVCHSAPILMNSSTKAAPIVYWSRFITDHDPNTSYSEAECNIMMVAATLDYRVIINDDFYLLDEWTDIVKSIEVFVSKPIYTYDQNGKISYIDDSDKYDTKFIGRLYAENADHYNKPNQRPNTVPREDCLLGSFTSVDFLNFYSEWEYSKIYEIYYSSERSYPASAFRLPEFTDKKMSKILRNTSQFYKLCSLDLAEAIADFNRKDIIVDDDYLQSLVTREVMTDDYLSHDRLQADCSFVYNNRINLAGLRRELFNGFLAQSMFAYCNKRYNWEFIDDGNKLNISEVVLSYDSYRLDVYIKENGSDYVVSSSTEYYDMCHLAPFNSTEIITSESGTTKMSKHSWGCYMFYPNPNAYKMVIYNYGQACYAVDLKPHEFLNGAYALLDYELVREKNFTSLPEVCPNDESFPIVISNKIYTSEVDNPFYFPAIGINTAGTGVVLGISSAVKALSQGQFGQFPLYAFTTEGVWALEVSDTGTYSAKQPITREVCINSDSITQIDSAVLFATDRGIMMISGSEVQCLSDSLKSEDLFAVSDLPRCDNLVAIFNSKADASEQLALANISLLPFAEFLAGCRMIYDYTNQHIIVYNPAVRYAYVYSLKSRLWGMVKTDITDNVNSYPEALAMAGTRLVDFSKSNADKTTALIVTRPFSMGDPNVFKTIDTIIQRGYIQGAHVSQVLYGSNDLFHWHPVWSSVDKYLRGFRGTPYKAFRLALICKFDRQESLYGFTVQFNPRMLNQPR